jgi:hypothetical protein
MALFKQVKCPRCDKLYSAAYGKCPYCGAKKNRDGKSTSSNNTKWQVIVGLVALIVIVLAVAILLAQSLNNKDPEASPSKSSAAPGGSGVTTVTPDPEQTPVHTAPPATPSPSPTPTPTPAPVVNSVVLNRSDFTLSDPGDTFKMVATVSPAGYKGEIIWISEDPNVATVDEEGNVTAVNHGNTIVSATAGGVTAECIVRVKGYAPASSSGNTSGEGTSGSTSMSLSHTDVTIHSAASEVFQLKVKGAPEGAAVTYSSSNSGVASVESNGRVKAVGNGTANITVTVKGSDGKETTLTCIVRVVN